MLTKLKNSPVKPVFLYNSATKLNNYKQIFFVCLLTLEELNQQV